MIYYFLVLNYERMINVILVFMSHFNFDIEFDEIIDYKIEVPKYSDIMIPDDYILEIRKLVGEGISNFSDFQTYPDNWGCHDKEIVSFVYNNRYCELAEMFEETANYLSIRIYPSRI